MKNSATRRWFYLSCLVIWIVVGLAPAVYRTNIEQEKLDEAFYAALTAPSPKELVVLAKDLREKIPKVQTWDEYGKILGRTTEYETALGKLRRQSWSDEDYYAFKEAEFHILASRTHIMHKVGELGTRERNNDASVGTVPEGGFRSGMHRLPESAPWSLYWTALWSSWIFAFLVLIVRLQACGQSVALELATPWWLLLATFAWPIGLFKYPTGDPARQLVRGLRFATFALSVALGMTPAAVSAQTKAEKDGKKKSSPYSFTIEGRNVRVVGPDPKPEMVVKSTITTPSGWVGQSTVSKGQGNWSANALVGHTVYSANGVRVDVVGGIARNSAGTTVVPVGVVASVNRPRWATVFPFAGYERRLDKPADHAVVVNQTIVKFGRWRAGAETFVKKVSGSPTQRYAGPVVARTVGRKWYAELVGYCNQTGEWRIRGRFSFAHSW